MYTSLALSIFLLAALGLGQLGGVFWFFDLFSHFPLHFFWLGLVCVLLLLFSARKLYALIPGIVVFISLGLVLPIYFQGPQKIPTATDAVNQPTYNELGVLFMNVHASNTDYDAITAEINRFDPDILCVAEASATAAKQIAAQNEQFTTLEYVEGGGVFDMALLSKHAPSEFVPSTFGRQDIPALLSTYEVDEQKLNIICAHPVPPVSATSTQDRNQHVDGLAQWVSSQSNSTVVIGDMNLTPWSPNFAVFIDESGLRDARQRYGYHGTWPTWLPRSLRIPIDHTFVSEDMTVVDRQVGKKVGGDHLPVYIRLRIE